MLASAATPASRIRPPAPAPTKSCRAAARRLASLELPWVDNEGFRQAGAEARILATPATSVSQPAANSWRAVRDLPAHLARLCEAELLSHQEERRLFERFNYAKFRADQLRRQLDPRHPARRLIAEIESLLEVAREARDQIVRANIRLAVSIAKKHATAANPFEHLLSDAIQTLLKAAEKFDFQRGFRFSTYATQAIQRTLWRNITLGQRERRRFQNAESAWFESKPEEESPGTLTESRYRELSETLADLLSQLDPRAREIIRRRFGLEGDGEVPTLQALAAEYGVCKERIRQLEKRALDKLRLLASQVRLQPTSAE